jgi:hypothetical protein
MAFLEYQSPPPADGIPQYRLYSPHAVLLGTETGTGTRNGADVIFRDTVATLFRILIFCRVTHATHRVVEVKGRY